MRSRGVAGRWGGLSAALVGVLIGPVQAADSGAGEGAASFLRLGVGARALAMGSAQTAIARGPEALHWNPALLVTLAPAEVSLGTARLGEDRTYSHGLVGSGFFWKRGDSGTEWSVGSRGEERDWPVFRRPEEGRRVGVALGMVAADQGVFEGRDDFGLPTGNFSEKSTAYLGGIGADLFEDLWMGAGVEYVRQDLGDASAVSLGFNVGAAWESPEKSWRVAAAARSIGASLAWSQDDPVTGESLDYGETVPMTWAGGGAYSGIGGRLTATAEASQVSGEAWGLRAGVEWRLHRALDLRAGIDRADPGAGIGLRFPLGWGEAALDYAYRFSNDAVEPPHWLTLSFLFGQRRDSWGIPGEDAGEGSSTRETPSADAPRSSSPREVPAPAPAAGRPASSDGPPAGRHRLPR